VNAGDLTERVSRALGGVTDPELDRSVVELGFARAAVDEAGRATVELRLPTFWCAPNFAYLMASDARDAVAAVPGVRSVTVRLVDHFVAAQVTANVNGGRSFDDAFPEHTDGAGLEALRRFFWVKAFTARQERLLRRLLQEGRSPAEVCAMRVDDLDPRDREGRAYLEKRERLGLSTAGDAALAVDPDGDAIPVERFDAYMSRARMTRVCMEANTALCGGLHATRYPRQQETTV
jgi:metal-sulfur cluster biosynthetic enzyme